MIYEWDEAKNLANQAKHGLSFEDMARFDWNLAVLMNEEIVDFELWEIYVGPLINNMITVVVTERGEKTRIISLRKALRPEIKFWKGTFNV